jgi:Domain of unknown function (DUF4878)
VVRTTLAILAAALAPAACGGDDTEAVKQTVREFIRATDQRDAGAFCGKLVTQQFLEQSTGAVGDEAQAACKQQLTAVTGLRLRLVRIRNTEIDGDRARVTAVLETQGRRQVRLLRLRKEDGDWKVAGGSGR